MSLNSIIIPYQYFAPIHADAKRMSGEGDFDEKTEKYEFILREFTDGEDRFLSQDFLKKFVKFGKTLEFEDYSLKRGRKLHRYYCDCCGYDTHNIFCDVPYQFFLSCENEFIANLGFEVAQDSILVSQIQGVRGQHEYLKNLKWSHLLLNVAEDWARKSDIPQIYVLPYRRNKWENVNVVDSTAKFYYDITAKRSGFVYDEEKAVYVKNLEWKR